MAKLLFVNACVRPRGVSRSLALADAFLEEYRLAFPQDEVDEVSLLELAPKPVTGDLFDRRERLKDQNAWDAPEFEQARRFAQADWIAVAAPMWELSFPAQLKAYIEQISVPGVTFGPGANPTGCMGLCRAKKLWYFTTRGGEYQGEWSSMDLAGVEWPALCRFFGIAQFESVYAEGLDAVPPQEQEQRMQEAKEKARCAARRRN